MWVNCKQFKNGTVLDLAGWPLTLLRSLAHRLGVVFMKRWVWWSGPHTRAEQMEDGLQEREDILAARETEFAHTQGNSDLVLAWLYLCFYRHTTIP